jgi:argininosuccinate synthase
VDRTQQYVTGTVRLKLYKGNATIAGRKSPYSLYNQALASFSDEGTYDQSDAAGFIRLFALPTRTEAQRAAELVVKPSTNGKGPLAPAPIPGRGAAQPATR